jgi:mRNA interferase RelE/StbE
VTYTVTVAAPALRSLHALPEAVAGAVLEFLAGPLAASPRRVGKALRFELEGSYSARRGDYRVIYVIDEPSTTVTVTRISHRRDAYRA